MADLSPEVERQIKMEERAHEIRMAMYRTPGLLGRLQEGHEASERGDVVPLDEVERELDRLDASEQGH